ncbi:hypothetical protein QJS04_geneDACA021309 [Acorus gramineus]|uniref:Reverse transcriptase zinc-binding domain-containing protein n=1 Tax=Acorus gramineus TaxID=55184 RepID=A0AAV9ANQ9_ACOGR|nr:hypothetical protein QJS04_geneDACA021309 [Acorus gramineus]
MVANHHPLGSLLSSPRDPSFRSRSPPPVDGALRSLGWGRFTSGADEPRWRPSVGSLSKAATCGEDGGSPMCLWPTGILRLSGVRKPPPLKIKVFLWLRWRGEESVLCALCGEEPESVAHLFGQCRVTCVLWREVGAATSLAPFSSLAEMWRRVQPSAHELDRDG